MADQQGGSVVSNSRKPIFWVCLLLAIYVVITPWGIQNQSVANPDEPLYAVSAREMLRGGDKFIPMFNTKLRLVKPIMFYWVLITGGAIGTKLGMPMLLALHLGSLFMGLLAALGTFMLGMRLRDARFAFFAAVILITAHRFHDLARSVLTDMTLTAFLVWAWFFFLAAVQRLERQANAVLPLLGFYLCLGLACLTKGPVLVAVFAVAPMVAYLFWTKSINVLKRAGLWWGIPLALVTGLWWFALLAQRGYGEHVYRFFTTQNFERFVAAEGADDHPWPYLFYFSSLGDAFLPWVVVVPVAIWFSWRAWRASPGSGLSWQARFLICALLLPFLIIGLSINKRSVYLLPLYPFLVLYLVWTAQFAFLQRDEDGRQQASSWRYRTAILVLAAACLWTLTTEVVIRPMRERYYAREEFYRQLDQLTLGRRVAICGLDIHEAVWYLDRPTEEIEDYSHVQLAAGVLPPPDRILVLREDFLSRHAELQEKYLVLGSKLTTRDVAYAVLSAKETP